MFLDKNTKPILLIDPDQSFLEVLTKDHYSNLIPPVMASSEPQAISIMYQTEKIFSGIFISLKLPKKENLNLVKVAHLNHPGTPLFFVKDPSDHNSWKKEELEKLAIKGILKKPLQYIDLMNKVALKVEFYELMDSLKDQKSTNEDVVNSVDFISLPITHFLNGLKCPFDIFIRLRPGKFLKILHKNELFTDEQLSRYLTAGTTYFYIRRKDQMQLLAYCDEFTKNLIEDKTASIEAKTKQTIKFGEHTLKVLVQSKITKESLTFAVNFVKYAESVVTQYISGKDPLLEAMMKNITHKEHSVSVTLVAALVMQAMKFESESTKSVLGLSCFLHDIGLYIKEPNLINFKTRDFVHLDESKYPDHPKTGGEYLSQNKYVKFPEMVITTISNHHSRRNKHKMTINPISEILEICDEFSILLTKSSYDQTVFVRKDMEEVVFPRYSFPVVDAFRKAIFPKP